MRMLVVGRCESAYRYLGIALFPNQILNQKTIKSTDSLCIINLTL